MSVNIVVPEMGESIVDARVARWLKKAGDVVSAGDPLVELETDKVDVEVSAPQNGVLESIAHAAGTDVKIGEVLGTIAAGAGRPAPSAASPAPAAAPVENRAVAATPSARKAAREQNVELTSVRTDGPRVTKADVDKTNAPVPPAPPPVALATPKPAAVAAPRTAAAVAGRPAGSRVDERVRMSKRRATIARRLVEAQQTAAMLTTFNEVDMTSVMALRERQKEAFKTKHGINLGIASFFVKAAIGALRAFPQLNAEIQG